MIFKLCCAILLLSACAPKHPLVEDLGGREDLSYFTLVSVRGARDGDRLDAQAGFSDSSSTLMLEMRFLIGPITKLQSGRWRWLRNNAVTSGEIAERSVTFLGGQSGPPSIGGRFDLLGSRGTPEYRITLPVTPVDRGR